MRIKNKYEQKPIGDYRQTGKTDLVKDRERKALHPGWRVSKNGKLYFENRKNRSDSRGKRV